MVHVNVVIWCFGCVLGEKVKKYDSNEAVMLVERFKTDILMYLVHHCR